MLPNFLIVGAQKAGTSALWSYLNRHPQVYLCPQKELRFFNRYYDLGLDWYRDHFRGWSHQPVVGEATPNYLYSPAVAERIAQTLPGVKLIFLFREPVSRAHSNYWHNIWLGREYLSFESAVEREEERMRLAERYRTPYWQWTYSYLDKGRYARQIRPYLERFDRSQMLFLLFEDITRCPEATLPRVHQFLGLESRPLPALSDEEKNSTWVQRSLALQKAVNALSYFVLVQSYEWLGWRRGSWGRTNALAMAIHAAQLKFNSVRGRYPSLCPETRERLAPAFAEENRELARLIGRDLDSWSFSSDRSSIPESGRFGP
jgi:hypothetical protein